MKRTIVALASLLCCSAALSGEPAAVKIAPTDGPGSSIYGPILYDPSGNIMSIGNNTAATSSYIYDPMGRLTSARVQRAGHLQSQQTCGTRTRIGADKYFHCMTRWQIAPAETAIPNGIAKPCVLGSVQTD